MSLSRRNFLKGGLLLGAGAIAVEALWIEKFFIEINEFYIGGATKESSNIKVVQISDLHIQSIDTRHLYLVNKLNKLKPDLLVFTGDSIDRRRTLPVLNEFLKLINRSIQKVAILGNREYWSPVEVAKLQKVYNENNCRLLINQTTQFYFQNKTMSITGVDDFSKGRADIDLAIKEYQKSSYHIILNHCPEYCDIISSRLSQDIHVDFILSGHTHGGQISLFGYAPYVPPGSGKYLKGWYNDNLHKVYVSKGIGTTGIPARFGARAEIAIFNLKA